MKLKSRDMKEQIKIAAKLYDCHETAKKLYKSEFPEKIKFYKEVIQGYMAKHNVDEMKAVIAICEFDSVKGQGIAIMLFMAAVVELIEPSK